jgi:adenosylhomocysteine nucleosidase
LILLVFPFLAELDAFLAGAGGRSETKVDGIRVFNVEAIRPDWRLAVCGQGKVEAALACQILYDALKPDIVLLLGSATALDPSLKAGDMVVADPCIEWDFGSEKPPTFKASMALPSEALSPNADADRKAHTGAMPERVVSGPILSGDRNVFDAEEKAALHRRFAAKALAWEGAGFHRFLRRSGCKGLEARLITETAAEGRLPLDTLQERMRMGFPAFRNRIAEEIRV